MKNVHNTIDEARPRPTLNETEAADNQTLWPQFAERADREGWPAARFLSANRRLCPPESHAPPNLDQGTLGQVAH